MKNRKSYDMKLCNKGTNLYGIDAILREGHVDFETRTFSLSLFLYGDAIFHTIFIFRHYFLHYQINQIGITLNLDVCLVHFYFICLKVMD